MAAQHDQDFSSRLCEWLSGLEHDGLLSKTYPDYSAANRGETLLLWLEHWLDASSAFPPQGWKNLGAAVGPRGLVEWGVLDAQWFGVPQRRRRVFLVRDTEDWTHRPPVLFERHSLQGHSPPSREKRESPTYPIAPCIGASGRGFERSGDTRGNDAVVAVTGPLSANGGTTKKHGFGMGQQDWENGFAIPVTHSLRAEGFDASEDGTGRGTPLVPVGSFQQNSMGGRGTLGWNDDGEAPVRPVKPQSDSQFIAFSQPVSVFDPTQITSKTNRSVPTPELCHTLTGTANPPIAFAVQERAICENPDAGPDGVGVRSDDTAYTLEACTVPQAVGFQSSQSGIREVEAHATLDSNNGSRRHNGVVQNFQVRRLTVEECEALQGLPRGYTNVVFTHGKPAADGPRYKALGNSMAVPVMRWIGERIQLAAWISDAD